MERWTWKDEAYEVIKLLGGHAYFSDIYSLVKERCKVNITSDNSMRASIRDIIQKYSSDSDKFSHKEDLFYAVDGKGNGHWGIRDFTSSIENVDLTQDDANYVEGKATLKKHILRERNTLLIRNAKQRFKDNHDGAIFCEVCGFNFHERYGEIGEDFIEAHHIKPVSEMADNETTDINDIVMLCSNCHSMIHRKKPWLTKDSLKHLCKR